MYKIKIKLIKKNHIPAIHLKREVQYVYEVYINKLLNTNKLLK